MHARRPSAVSKHKSSKSIVVEHLEPRRLLTTFTHAGNGAPTVFEFLDAQGNIEQINFFGNITAEVIGAAVQADNTPKAVDLPGLLNGAPIGGGIGGGSGSQTIGASTVNGTAAGVSALATDATGDVYYVTESTIQVAGPGGNVAKNIVQISTVDSATGQGTVVAEVSAAAVAAADGRFAGTNPMVTGVSGASFSPVDGRLYFVATGGSGNTPVLFSVDVTQGSSQAISATLTAAAGTFGSGAGATANVGAIAFDSTGAQSATLVAAINTGKSPQIVTVDPTNTDNLTNAQTPTIAGTAITTPITGLAFYPNTTASDTVYALTSATTASEVLNVNLTTGAATNYGNLPAAGQKQGQNPGDLTYDPSLTDPFTGQAGALLGTDTKTDTLFFVDPAIRSGTDSIFTIYVSQSDFTGGITVTQIPTSNVLGTPLTNLPSIPFDNTIGSLRVNNAQTGNTLVVGAPANTGEALLGARTIQIGTAADNNIPLLTENIPVGTTFGVLPTSITTLHAGLIVAPGQNMGNFLFAGTITGEVNIGAAINTFYAGWLLTGDATGQAGVGGVTDAQNFKVAGDIRNLDVFSSIGTDTAAGIATIKPDYNTGFDMFASGTVGAVQSGGSILGAINSADQIGAPTNGADQTETEFRAPAAGFDYFANDELGGNAMYNNDTYAAPQYLSNSYNALLGTDTDIVVDGSVQDDTTAQDKVDYYAVPLLAGQTITVQVADTGTTTTTGLSLVQTGVFDPDGREIASDYNQLDQTTAGKPFQFTTDRPGVYRFAVAPSGDSKFAGTSGTSGDLPYTLTISNVGHMAIGAIVAAQTVCDNTVTGVAGFGTLHDDLGAIVAGAGFISSSTNTVAVENGSVRALVGATIGTGAGGTDPEITVPNGNVGLVESTTGDMYFNNGIASQAIGGDYQVVSSAGNFLGDLIADGNIGTVRAQSIVGDTRGNSDFSVDDNHASGDGTIDLIDDAGNLGSFPEGGPSIKVGPNGTLKYLHVIGTVFGNPAFGNDDSIGQTTTYDAGFAVPITEASGAQVTLTPVVTTDQPAPALTVTTYGLDEGGSAVVKVVSTGGLTVQGTGNVSNQAFGIGTIVVQGEGNSVTLGASNLTQTFSGKKTVPILSPPTVPVANAPLDVVFSGTTQIDAFDVIGGIFNTAGIRTSNGNFNEIANNTPGGEIVNIHAASIDTLTGSGAVGDGIAHSTAAALLPNGSVSDVFPYIGQSNVFPFLGQRTGIVVDGLGPNGTTSPGQIVSVNLAQVGNIEVIGKTPTTTGNIGTIRGTISAPIFASGQINNVILGSGGIYPSGSGDLSDAGIYANGVIGNVVGTNADIRGSIISLLGIQSVNLQNGSIINSEISNYTALADSENIREGTVFINDTGGGIQHPILDLGSIVTNGSGGIIGSLFGADNIGVISSRNGFGIINSEAGTLADGYVGSVYADGYGLRGVGIFGGLNVGNITANGNGSLASTATFSNQVRYSERQQFDPFFGFEPSAATDIDTYLGATVTTPVIPGVTDTGVIEDSSITGDHNLNSVRAWSIRSATADANGRTTIAFSNAIGSIVTTGPVDGLSVTTGKLGTLQSDGDLMHTSLIIAGRINNLTVRSNITDSSSIVAHGKNGNIGKLTVFGNVDGLIEADGGRINNVTVHGSLFGKIKTKFIQNLILYQNLGSGSLEITGSAGTIRFVQDLGPAGNTLTVDGKVNAIQVGSNLTGNITVLGALNKLQVNGAIVTGSKVTVSKVLSLLQVGSDFQAGAVVQAHAVKKIKVRGVNAGSVVIV